MKKYVAIKKGFDGMVVREEGEVFPFEGKPGSWMKLAEGEKEEAHSSDKKSMKVKEDKKDVI